MSVFGNNNFMVNESGNSANIENYKIVIIGDQHVGKTSILSKYKYESLEEGYAPTVGIDFLTKDVFLEDKTIRLIMWDTAGQERFKSLIPSYLKNAHCIILTFDITNKSSFNSLSKWLKDVKENIQEGTFIVVCGNKLDLNNKRTVLKNTATNFCNENNLPYCETSAVTGEGISELFNIITKNFCDIPNVVNEIHVNNEKDVTSEPIRLNTKQGSVIVDNTSKNGDLLKRHGGCCGKK